MQLEPGAKNGLELIFDDSSVENAMILHQSQHNVYKLLGLSFGRCLAMKYHRRIVSISLRELQVQENKKRCRYDGYGRLPSFPTNLKQTYYSLAR